MAPILYIVSIAVCEFHPRGSPEMSSGQLRFYAMDPDTSPHPMPPRKSNSMSQRTSGKIDLGKSSGSGYMRLILHGRLKLPKSNQVIRIPPGNQTWKIAVINGGCKNVNIICKSNIFQLAMPISQGLDATRQGLE